MSVLELPEAARRVLGAARCSVREDEDGSWISEGEGEVRYLVRSMPDHLRLVRYDRGDDPRWQMSADDAVDLVRFLMVELGPVARQHRELVPVVFPTFDPGVSAGFDRRVEDGGIVVRQAGRTRGVFPPEDPFGVSRSSDFTWYADVDPDRIAELILTTTVREAR